MVYFLWKNALLCEVAWIKKSSIYNTTIPLNTLGCFVVCKCFFAHEADSENPKSFPIKENMLRSILFLSALKCNK